MSLRNVLHELLPLFKISWLDGLFQSPIKVASFKRLDTSKNIGIRLMDKVAFDLADGTPDIGICINKRYRAYILIFNMWPRRHCWIDRDLDVKALPISLLNKMKSHL